MSRGWVAYVLCCVDGSLYAGATNDLEARVVAHNAGRGSKYVRSRRPARVVWSRRFASEAAAKRQERKIKSLTRAEKLELIARHSLLTAKKKFRQS